MNLRAIENAKRMTDLAREICEEMDAEMDVISARIREGEATDQDIDDHSQLLKAAIANSEIRSVLQDHRIVMIEAHHDAADAKIEKDNQMELT